MLKRQRAGASCGGDWSGGKGVANALPPCRSAGLQPRRWGAECHTKSPGRGGSLCKVLGEPFESKYVFFKVMSTSLLSWIVSFLMVRFINQHS